MAGPRETGRQVDAGGGVDPTPALLVNHSDNPHTRLSWLGRRPKPAGLSCSSHSQNPSTRVRGCRAKIVTSAKSRAFPPSMRASNEAEN